MEPTIQIVITRTLQGFKLALMSNKRTEKVVEFAGSPIGCLDCLDFIQTEMSRMVAP